MSNTIYDKTAEYNSEISEKVKELQKLCTMYAIPYFMSFAVKNSEDKTEYVNEMLSPAAQGIVLHKNNFPNFVNVTNGFSTYLKQDDSARLEALRQLPEEIIASDFSLSDESSEDDDFYGEEDDL